MFLLLNLNKQMLADIAMTINLLLTILTTCKLTDNPVGIYLFRVNNGNSTPMTEICSKLTIKPPERRSLTSFWCLYCLLPTDFRCCSVFLGVEIWHIQFGDTTIWNFSQKQLLSYVLQIARKTVSKTPARWVLGNLRNFFRPAIF